MKKITVLIILMSSTLLGAQNFAVNQSVIRGASVNLNYVTNRAAVIVSDPTDTSTIINGSLACKDQNGTFHLDNSYFRQFDLSGLGQVEITDIDVGIETATGGNGVQPITIRVHSMPDGSTLPSATMTLVAEFVTTINDVVAGMVNFPILASLDAATEDLVIEVFTPSGVAGMNEIFMGSNASTNIHGETFLLAPDCNVTTLTSATNIGATDMHTIIVVNGMSNTPVELMNFSIE